MDDICAYCGATPSIDHDLFALNLTAGERRLLMALYAAQGRELSPGQVGHPDVSLRTFICRLREKLQDEGLPWRIEHGAWGSCSYRLVKK